MNQYGDFGKETEELMTICERNDRIPPELFKEFGVKRGLRDVDGTGVLAGISNISRIDAFKTEDGKKVPCDGQLWYRGYNVQTASDKLYQRCHYESTEQGYHEFADEKRADTCFL